MKRLTIYLGADHAGFALKEKVKTRLEAERMTVIDLSPTLNDGDDYPLEGKKVAEAVVAEPGTRGILVCGSGVGVSIAANRIPGARAFDAHSEKETILAREHTNANIMSLAGWSLKEKQAMKLIDIFLKTTFSAAKRHHRRVEQLG